MGPTGELVNVIQVHPTRRCNLRCQHCYSTSGPELAGELPVELIETFLEEAVSEGFNVVGVSGGEPLTYGPLPRLVACARALGYYTSVTTNGLLLDARRLSRLAPHLSLLAISLDGVPESHDRVRARAGAFEMMRRKLDVVRASGISFGFIFSFTLNNLDQLDWVAEFAAGEGASLLQVHPLERVGRAAEYDLVPPDELELSYGFLEVERLQRKFGDKLRLQYDVADRTVIEAQPDRAFALPAPASPPDAAVPLASLVSPLVLQDDGWVVPLQHGFSTKYALARLGTGEGFRSQAARWKRERYERFLELSRRTWDALRPHPPHLPFTNWYAAISALSAETAGLVSPSLTRRDAVPPPLPAS
jgi:MoaA/NifB/PqqE/SkfB family radical SAM enzyme